MLFTSNEPLAGALQALAQTQTNVMAGPALKGVSNGAGRRNPNEPTTRNMLEAFY